MYKQIERIIRSASELLKSTYTITYKEKDLVTENDIKSERYIIGELKKLYPNDLFISEEENQNTLTDERTWIIDPIDGTLNYSRNIPQYGIQIALYEKKAVIFAMIYLPLGDDLIYAMKNAGCFYNHQKVIPVKKSLDQSIITFGDFSSSQKKSRPLQIQMMAQLMDHVMKIRIYGASSSDFFYAIIGRSQGHIMFSKRIWEFSAGLFLAEEAGLKVDAFEKNNVRGFMIAEPTIAKKIRDICL